MLSKAMKRKVTKSEMLREVMLSARAKFRLIGRFSWVKETTWAECLKSAWESIKMRFFVERKPKAVKVVKIERYFDGIDKSFLYGRGTYNGD